MGSTHDWLLRLKWTSSMYIRWAGGQLLTGVVTLSTNPPPNLTPARQRLAFCRHNDDGMTLAVTPSCSTVSPASIWPRRQRLPSATSYYCCRAAERYLPAARRDSTRRWPSVKKRRRMARGRPAVGRHADSCHVVKLLSEETPTAGSYGGTASEGAPTAASDTSRYQTLGRSPKDFGGVGKVAPT
ncbi:hypothetical protein PCASD_26785 [Puccinia coronata f. sp. avenae]|uniref:Uncharacterized protein n=1 Tax=Puccinia coronata f. sp. avenae TaxID=200324 RepID=A0A2N5RTK2_9BASI|nr:hypothetical protein PCASD_26785 [Puccinia coronata f. sp. avenae]